MTGVVYNNEDEPRYEYTYNAQGQVAHVRNNLLGRTTASEYDLANRPCRVKTHTDDGVHVYTGEVAYDDVYGNLSEFKEKVGEARTEYSTTFGYDEENRPTSLSYGAHGQTTLTYDKLGRVRQSSVKAGSGVTNTTTYAFEAGGHGENSTTGLVKSISQTGGNFAYTYDDNGNIVSVVQDGKTTAYTYDELGQLIRVDDEQENATWVYAYDMGGNILSKQKFAYGVTDGEPLESKVFTYGNANWKDQLTAVNDVPITYDEIGNPLNDGEWTYTWQNGRQLASMTDGTTTASFVYNEQGLRVQKTVNGVVTKYTLHGKNVVHMTQGSNSLHFFYDAQNKPAVVVYNGTAYAYVKNLQGDIIAILDSAGTAVVSYTYDAWGAPTGTTGTMAATLGVLNPFRYRGYVYDEDTRLYYLRSRYYAANMCRFLNADAVFVEKNKFSYCNNAPVYYMDSEGYCSKCAYIHTDSMILYDIPVYYQGDTGLCWAFCQVVREEFDKKCHWGTGYSYISQSEAELRAREIEKEFHNENCSPDTCFFSPEWHGGFPLGIPTSVPNELRIIPTLQELYTLLEENGPLFIAYRGTVMNYETQEEQSWSHAVVLIGVDLCTESVYMYNPAGFSGCYSYEGFTKGYIQHAAEWNPMSIGGMKYEAADMPFLFWSTYGY